MAKKPPKNYQTIKRGSVGFPEKGSPNALEQYMNSSHANAKPLNSTTKEGQSQITAAFEKAFDRMASKTPFEETDIQIYRHGVIFRPKEGRATSDSKEHVSQALRDIPGAYAHFVTEDKTFSVRVNMGSSKRGEDFIKAYDNMQEYEDALERIRRIIEDEYGDLDWFVFWDTEEAMYE